MDIVNRPLVLTLVLLALICQINLSISYLQEDLTCHKREAENDVSPDLYISEGGWYVYLVNLANIRRAEP